MRRFGNKLSCYWFTGLPGAGKTTLVNHISARLSEANLSITVLDGDYLRLGLNKDLGFSREDRRENARRIAEVAKLMVDMGTIVLVASISPYSEDRRAAREILGNGRFFEVHVMTDLATCSERDPKRLYARARSGEIRNLTGWGAPYEESLHPEFCIETLGKTVSEASFEVINHILDSTIQ